MNVLLVSQYLHGGGLERMVHLLADELSNGLGCRVFLFSFDSDDDAELRERLKSRGITAIHRPKAQGFSFRSVLELIRLIRRERIDVVHTHESAPLIYAAIARLICGRRVRLVHTQHSFIHLQKRPFIRHYDRFFQHAADAVAAVSEQVRAEYGKIGVPSSRVRFLPNGVEFPARFPNASEKAELRQSLIREAGIPALSDGARALWFISVARVHPRKGQDHLIRAWGELPEAIRSRSLLIFAGPETSPGERERLDAMVSEAPSAGRVVFIGRTTSPVQWLMSSDVFLSGSEYEGMPLAPIEASGAGLPIVLSDIQGHRLLEEGARYFSFSDPAEGARQLSECVRERDANPESFARKYRERAFLVQKRFSISKMAREYYGLYSGGM